MTLLFFQYLVKGPSLSTLQLERRKWRRECYASNLSKHSLALAVTVILVVINKYVVRTRIPIKIRNPTMTRSAWQWSLELMHFKSTYWVRNLLLKQITEHSNGLLTFKNNTSRLLWCLALQLFWFQVLHCKEQDNANTDYLSRQAEWEEWY